MDREEKLNHFVFSTVRLGSEKSEIDAIMAVSHDCIGSFTLVTPRFLYPLPNCSSSYQWHYNFGFTQQRLIQPVRYSFRDRNKTPQMKRVVTRMMAGLRAFPSCDREWEIRKGNWDVIRLDSGNEGDSVKK